VHFYAVKRIGGAVTNSEAIKVMKFHDLSAGAHAWVVDRGAAMVADGEGGWADAPAQADGYHVGGQRIVGARGAAVANPSAGTTIDTEARAAIIAILDRMRAHGLIAAS
jgi:hypothetical protein